MVLFTLCPKSARGPRKPTVNGLCNQSYQVMQDYRGVEELLAQGNDTEGFAAIKAEWVHSAERYMRSAKVEETTSIREKTKVRGKAHGWCLAVDHLLLNHTGVGLSQFAQPMDPGSRGDPWKWPHLFLSSDQGAECVAGFNFLTTCP